MGKSLMEQLATLSEEERNAALEGVDMDALLWDWKAWGRPEQQTPEGDWAIWLFLAGRGAGKDLSADTPIRTPSGWKLLADIEIGDTVFAHDGSRTTVTAVVDYDDKPIYRVTFQDGSYVDASDTHEWTVLRGKNIHIFSAHVDVRDRNARSVWASWCRPLAFRGAKIVVPPEEVVSLAARMSSEGNSWRSIEKHLKLSRPDLRPFEVSRNRLKQAVENRVPTGSFYTDRTNVGSITISTKNLMIGDAIPACGSIDCDEVDLPIHPYLFGLWLGDGFTRDGGICGAPGDLQFYLDELNRLGAFDDWVAHDMGTPCGKITSSKLGSELRKLGLSYGKNAEGKRVTRQKRVPEIYLNASMQQRLALLQGIMDTDGSVDLRDGRGVGIGLINKNIDDAVYDLAAGLGFIVHRRVRVLKSTEHRQERDFYGCSWYPDASQTDFIPFRLPRKVNAMKTMPRAQATRKTMRRIVSIEKINNSKTRCIAVDHPDHLFLAGRGLVATHNTRTAAEWVREQAKYTTTGQRRFALVARTAADVRDVIVEGESGIINVSPPSEKPLYEPSKRRLTWPNGNTATCFCASEDTEVLTRDRGWVRHEQLTAGDTVLTLNTVTGQSEWQIAQGVYRFAVNDVEVARISGRFHDSLTTMNHRWPVWDRNGRVRWTTTEEIADGVAGTKSRIITAAPNANVPTHASHSDALVEIVAWYMTEGTRRHDYETSSYILADTAGWNAWLDKHAPRTRDAVRSGRKIRGPKTLRAFCDGRGLNYDEARQFFAAKQARLSIGISQSQTVNPSKCADIRRALTEHFGPCRDIGAPTGRTWTEYSPVSGRNVIGFCIDPDAADEVIVHFDDPKNKVLSREFVLSLTRAQLELFVARCLDGDGHRKASKTYSMGQNNAGRDDVFAFALTLLGVPYSQFVEDKQYKNESYPWFATSTRRSPGVPLVPRIVSGIEVQKYTGIVWCPRTENSTWFARRNGKVYFTGNTADEPDSLRGPQFTHAWGDEVAAWRQTPDAAGMTAFDNLRVGTRLGANPQIMITTTPKRVPLLYSLLKEAEQYPGRVRISRGSTLDNAGNLSSAYLNTIVGVYEGTRLAAQELFGEMLDDVEGALWTIEMIERSRETAYPIGTPLRVIGVDPSVAENPRDECGIVVCASSGDRDLYKRNAWVLEDATIHGSPETWANKVVEMARKWSCPVVAEVNQGGALVRNAINAIDPNVKVLEVHSKYGKALRAEPITLAYEQNRVHHVGYLADLESQMCAWIPGEGKSPDRVDALVHALTALLIKPPPGFVGGAITAKSPAARRLPSFRNGNGNSGGGRVFMPKR